MFFLQIFCRCTYHYSLHFFFGTPPLIESMDEIKSYPFTARGKMDNKKIILAGLRRARIPYALLYARLANAETAPRIVGALTPPLNQPPRHYRPPTPHLSLSPHTSSRMAPCTRRSSPLFAPSFLPEQAAFMVGYGRGGGGDRGGGFGGRGGGDLGRGHGR